MLKSRFRSPVLPVIAAALLLLACETTNLIGQSAARRPTARRGTSSAQQPTRDPALPYEFIVLEQPRCSTGDSTISIVNGTVTRRGLPAAGQLLKITASPGYPPVDQEFFQADQAGNFQADLVCGGSACSGSYLLWLVNDSGDQISPSIEYIFDDQCRRGTVNFGAP